MFRERLSNVRLDLLRMQRELSAFDSELVAEPHKTVMRCLHDLLAILVRVIDSLP